MSEELQKRPPTELMTVRRACDGPWWQRSAAAEGRWGSLTKCRVTKCMMDRRSHDGPSCWFVVMIREVVSVHKFLDLKCYRTKTLDRLLCL